MKKEILRLMSFRLSGKFANFRKFYSNSSSLSYFIPPRTAIAGMLASILEIPRNEYYERFSPDICGISISIETPLKKKFYSMNYLDQIGGSEIHSQCKLEVISAQDGGQIRYRVYLAVYENSFLDTFSNLTKRIKLQELGYGIYLGQRQFKGEIDEFCICDSIKYIEESDQIQSLCRKDNFIKWETEDKIILCSDNIPLDMIKTDKSDIRKTTRSEPIIYEQNGRMIKGKFSHCYEADDKIIGFYE